MGLFNFNFGGSKKGQNQPIRDKIKNRKHFEKLLSKEKEIIKQRNEIISKSNQNDTNSYIYYAIANNYMNLLKITYSLGVKIKDLRETYIVSLQSFLLGFESNEPMYFDILNRVALGFLLNISNENSIIRSQSFCSIATILPPDKCFLRSMQNAKGVAGFAVL